MAPAYPYLIILVLEMCIRIASCINPFYSEINNISSFNATTIGNLIEDINGLHLYWRNVTDIESSLMQFLLIQSKCPVSLSFGAWNKVTENINNNLNNHLSVFVIYSHEIMKTLKEYVTRKGITLFLLLDVPTSQTLLRVAEEIWLSSGVHRVYYIAATMSVYYDPFLKRTSNYYGILIDMNTLTKIDRSIIKNFNGYPLRVYIFHSVYSRADGDGISKTISKISGADAETAILLSQKLNFTLQLQWPDDKFFGTRLENGSFDGALGRMIRYETDVTFTGFFIKDYLTKKIEFSVSVYMDDLCCYVRKANRIPQSILPLFAVNIDVWSSFLAVGILSPFLWMTIRCLNLLLLPLPQSAFSLIDHIVIQFLHIFNDTWVVWVRVNIIRFPPFSSERIFVISICLVSVIFGALFESSLATVYIRPLYYRDINTMQELDNTNYKIYIKHGAMKDDLFDGHDSFVYQNLNRKLILVAELEERLISMMSKRGGFAAVTRASSLVLDDIQYFITNKIHKIPECPKSYHIAFVFPKHSSFQIPIDLALLHFIEAGLINRWIEDMKYKAIISIQKSPSYFAEQVDNWKVLSLSDLQLGFYTLLMGGILSTIIFFIELFVILITNLFNILNNKYKNNILKY